MKLEFKETVVQKIEYDVKPCPFCGGKPHFQYSSGFEGYTSSAAYLICDCCGARVEVRSSDCKSERQMRQPAIDAWDRRV